MITVTNSDTVRSAVLAESRTLYVPGNADGEVTIDTGIDCDSLICFVGIFI